MNTKFYKKVNTNEEKEMFNGVWQTCWAEKGFEFEYFNTPYQYLFFKKNNPAACVELKELKQGLTSYYASCKELKGKNVVEIDKLSILNEYRSGNILLKIFSFLYEFAEAREVDYYVSIIEPNLYSSLMERGFPFNQVDEPFYYKGDYVVPVVLDVQKALGKVGQKLRLKKTTA
ncbi:hypothetical protein ABEY63_25520 [Priestia aryabhattai]|uniref:hypothetical protein n=1 Tax=Priestia aryabhattai TaxID=412384 RepID=UPI003D2A23B4